MRGQYKKISTKQVYKGKHMQVYRDEVIYPGGEEGIYEHYKKKDIIVIIPIFKNQYILIEQYRYLANERMIEFPMGLIRDGESIENAGIRELKEETGFISNQVKYLGKCMLNKGATSQVCHFAVASIQEVGDTHYDKSESDIEILYKNSDEIKSMIQAGKILDAPTMIGFMYNSFV